MLASFLLAPALPPRSGPSSTIQSKLQEIADRKAAKYDCNISIAVQTGTDAYAAASTGSAVDDKYVWGSVTKQFTGVALLQEQAAGSLDLDAPVQKYLDPYLAKVGLGSMTKLFGPHAAEITARQLATMASGVPDYDTAKPSHTPGQPPTDAFRAEVYASPAKEYTPALLVNQSWVATGRLDFPPGSSTRYSSTNFVLLGLLLAAVSKSATWDAYPQGSIFAHLPAAHRELYQHLEFGVHGAPADHAAVHGYDRTSYNGGNSSARPGHDVWRVAGVYGGWTASDVTASAADVARFGYDLYGAADPQLLPPAQKAVMVPPPPEGEHYFPYGFATFNLTEMASGRSSGGPYRTAYGHLGATYGYQSVLAFYPGADLAIAVASDIETDYQTQPNDALCEAYNTLLPLLTSAEPQQCALASTGYFSTCSCGNTYRCSHLLRKCVRDERGTLSRADCEKGCGAVVEEGEQEAQEAPQAA